MTPVVRSPSPLLRVDPSALVVTSVAPGLEDAYPDWRCITMRDSPYWRALMGEQWLWRVFMLHENRTLQPEYVITRAVRQFNDLARVIGERTRPIAPPKAIPRSDGRLVIYDGEHRVALHMALRSGPLAIELHDPEVYVMKLRALGKHDLYFREHVAPLRMEIATCGKRQLSW